MTTYYIFIKIGLNPHTNVTHFAGLLKAPNKKTALLEASDIYNLPEERLLALPTSKVNRTEKEWIDNHEFPKNLIERQKEWVENMR